MPPPAYDQEPDAHWVQAGRRRGNAGAAALEETATASARTSRAPSLNMGAHPSEDACSLRSSSQPADVRPGHTSAASRERRTRTESIPRRLLNPTTRADARTRHLALGDDIARSFARRSRSRLESLFFFSLLRQLVRLRQGAGLAHPRYTARPRIIGHYVGEQADPLEIA